MKTFDLEYVTTGLFTRFIPHTKAGEDAWREMAAHDAVSIFTMHKAAVLAQLRAAGYSVRRAPKRAPVTALEIDNLLAELGV